MAISDGVDFNSPKNTNCAQKLTIPKNGKLRVMRLRNVLATLGVQTALAAGLLDNSEHGLRYSGCFEQSNDAESRSDG